ncbi:MAG: VTT domain-containing protein [Candidatus Azambacteria bacterium]|nr:VTT domain-containing protein [Candidatus Azambacteria bacterium]
MELFFGFDLSTFIKGAGYLGLLGIIFAESGLLLGFFLPGDSLLFTAGFLASQGYFNIMALIVICFIGAILGDSFGYAFGKKTGSKLFTREGSLMFKKSHIDKAKIFYEAYGGKTIVLARFMPVIRTFAPILAGVGEMKYSVFLFYNVIGGALWAIGLPLAGYFLGTIISDADKYIIPIIAIIIVVSILPPIIHILKDEEHKKEIKNTLKKIFKL